MTTQIHISTVPEEPGGVHAQEAAGHHQEGGEYHQILVREQYIQWALFSDKIVSIKTKFNIIIHAVSFYMALHWRYRDDREGAEESVQNDFRLEGREL